VSFATAAPRRGFGPRRVIETVGRSGMGRFVGARPGSGSRTSATAARSWRAGFDGARFVARAAPVAQGHVGTPQQLSPAGIDAALGDIAVAEDGRALALWRSDVAGADPVSGGAPHLFGNVRAAAAAAFGSAEAIGDARTVLTPPTAVVDPQTRRPIALFTDFAASGPFVSVRPPTVP
jgi:hypothetical protein